MGDFGGKLRQARERRGVSLRQISSATKISVGVLEALERNDVSRLPGGIFSRAFVRSYASEVGLDPDETIRDFVSEFSTEERSGVHSAPPPAVPVSIRESEPGRQAAKSTLEPVRRTIPTVEIVPDESEFESQQRMASVVLRLLLVSVPIVLAILYFSLRGQTPAASTAGVAASRPAPEDAPPPPASMDPVLAPVGAATVGREPATSVQPPIPAVSPDQQTIELRPGAPCWVSLTIDGSPSFTREMQAGERVVRTFRDEAVLKVGDAAACEFALNGRIAKPLGGSGQPRTVKITPQNVASYLP